MTGPGTDPYTSPAPIPGQVPPVHAMPGYLPPGQPMPGGPVPMPAAVPAPPMLGTPAPVPSRRRRQVVSLTILIVLVAALGGAIWYFNRNSPDGAKVGDCVRSTGSDSVAVIACTDPAAQYKVVGRVENQTEIDAGISSCDAFDDATVLVRSAGRDGLRPLPGQQPLIAPAPPRRAGTGPRCRST
jgi:hypothetical protein